MFRIRLAITWGLFVCVGLFVGPRVSHAELTVSPGTDNVLELLGNYEVGADNDCGFLASCQVGYSHDLDAGMIGVTAEILEGIYEDVWAEGYLFTRFRVDGQTQSQIPAIINAKVKWRGIIANSFGFNGKASIQIDLRLYDVTNENNVNLLAQEDVFSTTCDGLVNYFCGTSLGDWDTKDVTFSTVLSVGHSYQIRLRARAAAKTLAGLNAGSSYTVVLEPLEAASPRAFRLTLGEDPIVRIEALERQVAALMAAFQTHSHTYKTGIGVGHNKVDAATSSPDATVLITGAAPVGGIPAADDTRMADASVGDRGEPMITLRNAAVGEGIEVELAEAPVTMVLSAEVFDVSGRRVRTLSGGASGPEGHVLRWDKRDDSGLTVSGGIYWLRVRADDRVWTEKLVLLK